MLIYQNVNSAFVPVASLDFGVFRDSLLINGFNRYAGDTLLRPAAFQHINERNYKFLFSLGA